MTLEEYLRYEYADGKIDFSMRVGVYDEVRVYIHPTGRNGTTTPSLVVEGNTVRIAPGCFAPGWNE